MFVQCRVLAGTPSKPVVEVSLRQSRLEGDLDDDVPPEKGNTIQAYVVETSSKGCFLRISRQVEGRTILKELCDGFLPNPSVSFPTGRLVVGKVKQVNSSSKKIGMKLAVDVDMRESTLVTEGKVSFEDIEIGSKYNGTVTRIEDYGVFVRLESSDVSGLVHKSECSDNYIKSLTDLYDPGDLVKLLVLKKNDEKKQLGFSMKASNFINDDDSDVESHDSGLESGGIDIDMDDDVDDIYVKRLTSTEYDDAEDSDANIEGACDGSTNDTDENSVESDEEEGDDEDLVMPSSSKGDANAMEAETKNALDTNVGFDWIGTSLLGDQSHEVTSDKDLDSDADESEIDDDDDDGVLKSSHKSRKKQAQRRKEEEETNRLEMSLADGTADENPETAADFERLLAGDPNSSELWIRYMAFHLTLANIPTAREVAERAFARIEFRQEKEKLNVWSALLTLEYKYGNDETLQKALDRACQHNNPKYVYLRVCEMMEKQAATPESIRKTDEMFAKMCKKFKSKKKVWIANMEYMLKNGRQEEAYEISKRALLSLKQHKHIETMSKFAQLVFQYGRAEKARTLFDGLLMKYPKRLDLFFVYVDKELKFGDLETARSLYARIASPTDEASKMKLGDKQMKLYFKKWFNFEQMHGDEESQERVKSSARAYVENST